MTTNCDHWRDAILLRSAGELGSAGLAALDRHLADCPECRADAAAWQALALEARAAVRRAELSAAPPASLALGKVRAATAATAVATSLTAATALGMTGDGALSRATGAAGAAARFRRPLDWTPSRWLPGLLAVAACAALLLWLAGPPWWSVTPRQAVEAPSGPGPGSAASLVDAAVTERSASFRMVAVGRRQTAAVAEPQPSAGPDATAAAVYPVASAHGGTRFDQSVASLADRSSSRADAPAAVPPAATAPPAAPPEAPAPADDADEVGPNRHTPVPEPPDPRPTGSPMPPPPSATLQPTRPGMARIAGRVEDPDGRPVFMALVYLRPAGSGESWGVVLTDTDDRGGFAVDLPPGRWELWVEAAGLQPWHYQDEPVLELGGQDERRGILLRLPGSPPPPSGPTASPSPLPPTGTLPAAANIRIAPILPPAGPTSPLPDPIEPEEWMP